MTDEALPFARYLRATGEGQATRYGPPHTLVPKGVYIALTTEEALRFRREYDRQIREGALEEAKQADYTGWIDRRNKEAIEARKKAEAEAKKAADDKAKAEAEAQKKAKDAQADTKRSGKGGAGGSEG